MVTFIPDTIPTNPVHIRNLKKLKALLKSDKIPPPSFHMGHYAIKIKLAERLPEIELTQEIIDREFRMSENAFLEHLEIFDPPNTEEVFRPALKLEDYGSCGTVCCAIGHGPLAGVEVPKGVTNWDEYCYKVFGTAIEEKAWRWLFSYQWAKIDNTAKGAAKRIGIYLENGIPSNYREQMLGEEPLMY
jgi:hypothetical protein